MNTIEALKEIDYSVRMDDKQRDWQNKQWLLAIKKAIEALELLEKAGQELPEKIKLKEYLPKNYEEELFHLGRNHGKNEAIDLCTPILAKLIEENERISKSIIEISIKGTEDTKFRSVPEMVVALVHKGKKALQEENEKLVKENEQLSLDIQLYFPFKEIAEKLQAKLNRINIDEISKVTVGLVEKNFPKGVSKERGAAIVLHAEILIEICKLKE